MKPINEMTLAECIERLRELPDGTVDDACDKVMLPHLPWIFDVAVALADRIEELTRWIPVAERMPTEEDGGFVNGWYNEGYSVSLHRDFIIRHGKAEGVTHWRRIDKPEDK